MNAIIRKHKCDKCDKEIIEGKDGFVIHKDGLFCIDCELNKMKERNIMTTKLFEVGIDLFTNKYCVDVITYNDDMKQINKEEQFFVRESDCLVVGIEKLRARLRIARKEEKGK